MRSLRSPDADQALAHAPLPSAAARCRSLVEQPRREHRHRLRAVAVLRAVVLALDDEAGRQVRDAHRRVGLVDVLAAGARRAERVDAQVGRIDRDVGDRIGFRQHGDRARRRVDAALRLGLRHALHAMAARLELELRIRAVRRRCARSLPCSRRARDGDSDTISTFQPLPLGVARVHPEEVAGEQRRLVAAGAGADFEEHVALVVRDPSAAASRCSSASSASMRAVAARALLVGERASSPGRARARRAAARSRFAPCDTRRSARRPARSRRARCVSAR